MNPTFTLSEYMKKPAEYRGTIDGKPALLYMDPDTGGTCFGPVTITQEAAPAAPASINLNSKYIPAGAQPVTDPRAPGAIVYIFINRDGHPAAIAYTAGATKHSSWNFWFRDEARRNVRITEWFDNLAAHHQRKTERRNESKTWRNGYQPGDILNASWGYDQTNQEFYQVVEVSAKSNSVVIREIAHQNVGSERVTPCPNRFVGPARHVVAKHPYDGKGKGDFHFTASPDNPNGYRLHADEWDGRPCYETDSMNGH